MIATPDGTPRRKVVPLQPGGEYRLHYFRHASEDFTDRAAALSDLETLRLIAYLQLRQVGAARTAPVDIGRGARLVNQADARVP